MDAVRSFGRKRFLDKRDQLYRLDAGMSGRKYRYWPDGRWFGDQGNAPHCVGYAWAHWLVNYPISQWVDPDGLYAICQHFDEWPGESYDGTSVRAGAKVLRSLGFIHQYRWASSLDAVVYALLEKGPVVAGTEWREGMSRPDARGLVRAEGAAVGGHAYLLTGVNTDQRLLRIKNSWGESWGDHGRAWIGFDDFKSLLARDGEACLAIERRASPE